MTDQPTNVVAALARVQADIGGIEKLTPDQRRKRGQGGDERGISYAYRGIDQIAAAAQPLFGKYGVIIAPDADTYEAREITVNGKPWTDATLTVNWRVYGPGGLEDFLEARTVGLGRDNSDKAANKAMTGAYKNLLLRLLCIGDPDDDTDGQTHERDAESPDDVNARRLGHESYADQVSRFENLRDATLELNAEDVKAWVKEQHITKNTLTNDQVNQWNVLLNEFSAAVAADAAADTLPPATPPAGPTHSGGTEPDPAAAGSGGTRAQLGERAAATAAKKALAHAGLTESETA